MTPASRDLATRLAAHPRFEWRAGMLTADGWRVLGADEDPMGTDGRDGGWIQDDSPLGVEAAPPDLSDPATVGCLLVMLWEETQHVTAFWRPGAMSVGVPFGVCRAATLGAAVAEALLAAWGPA